MADDKKFPPLQGSSALSCPMREDDPAARITPANDGDSRMQRQYYIPSLRPHNRIWNAAAGVPVVRRFLRTMGWRRPRLRRTLWKLAKSLLHRGFLLAGNLQLLEHLSRLGTLHVGH